MYVCIHRSEVSITGESSCPWKGEDLKTGLVYAKSFLNHILNT